jgi:hypothetical protein
MRRDLIEDVPVPDDGVDRAHRDGSRRLARRQLAVRAIAVVVVVAMSTVVVMGLRRSSDDVTTLGSIPRSGLNPPGMEGSTAGSIDTTSPSETPTTGTQVMPHSTGADILTVRATLRLPRSATADPGALEVNQACQGGGAFADLTSDAVVEIRTDDGQVLSASSLGSGTGFLATVNPTDPRATVDSIPGSDPQLMLEIQCGFHVQGSFNRVLQVSDRYEFVVAGRVLGSKTLDELQHPADFYLGP